MGIKHIHGSATSLNGCKVDIDGDVHYSLILLRIIAFHGSVHLSGEQSVPNGDLYFGIEPDGNNAPLLSFNEQKPSVKPSSNVK
jgi:hypothetical protein